MLTSPFIRFDLFVTDARHDGTMAGVAFTRQVGNLPAEVTSFVGRRHEMAAVKQLMSTSRLVTLTGVGGVGKTRLALRVAVERHRAFDAVWLVDLTELNDPSLISQTVAAVVGLRDQPACSPTDALGEFFGSQRALLVLDNCEHLIDSCAVLTDALLRAAPTLQILATSRQSLRISGESIVMILPLCVPDPDSPMTEGYEPCEAVDLFAQRAAAVLPGFVIDEHSHDTVIRLCRRLDGLPLAIELAAVRLRAFSLGDIVRQLDDRFRWLTGGSRASLPRQRTLHALVDWSYQLLTPGERTLWERISLFPGHFDLDAVESVCAYGDIEPRDVVDLLDDLVDKSLLLREERDGRVRYRMLETLRQFCHDKLGGPDERRTLSRRHRDWYGRLAERAAADWFGPEQAAWFARLKLEHSNIRAALDFCLREPGEAESGLRMAIALQRPFWLANSFYDEGRQWLDRLLRALADPTAPRAQGLYMNARLAIMQGDTAAALPMLRESLTLAKQINDPHSLAFATGLSGMALLFEGHPEKAAPLLRDALERHTARGDQIGITMASIFLGLTLHELGDNDGADALCEECLARSMDLGESWYCAWALTWLALDLWTRGQTTRAASLARESLRRSRRYDDRPNIALNVELLAWSATLDGDHERGARLLGAAKTIAGTMVVSGLQTKSHIQQHDRCTAMLLHSLGDTAFTKAHERGSRLTLPRAVEDALRERASTSVQEPERERTPSPLTRRESEIAELIAKGMSNKDIAATLVIAQRTAEAHVEHILTKLGFSSRTQIAVWFTTQTTVEQE
ncbi:LuxR C-terminal-related transcriptional regulator [Nonomuraea sp. NPDC026600]|uniref:ATP-binding protein n=1 Tax=Nonomuraea sp. NPDC026600 TaxID=3155363 RepID=UPI0033DFCD34